MSFPAAVATNEGATMHTGTDDGPWRALLVPLDTLDEGSSFYLHAVGPGTWTLSEITLERGTARVLHVTKIGPVIIPRPVVMVELGADLRQLPNGATTTVTTVANAAMH